VEVSSKQYPHQIIDVSFSADAKTVAVADELGAIVLFDTDQWEERWRLDEHGSWIATTIALSPDGARLVSGNESGAVEVWNLVGPPLAKGLPRQAAVGSVAAAEIDRESRRVAVGSGDGTLALCTDEGQAFHCNHDENRFGTLSLLALSPRGDWSAMTEGRQSILLNRPQDDPRSLRVPPDFRISSVEFSSNGSILAASGTEPAYRNNAGDSASTIIVWDVTTGLELGRHSLPLPVSVLAFSPTQDAMVVGAAGNEVVRWSVSDGELVDRKTFAFRYGQVSSLAFDPEGENLVSGNKDGSITVWNANGELYWAAEVESGSDSVRSLTFSPDGRYVASGSEWGEVIVWDIEEQEQIGVVAAVEAPVFAVAWLADEPETLVVVDGSGSIHEVETELDVWSDRACHVAGRGFTEEEASHYFGQESSEVCRDLLDNVSA
jgi:WD40 repeat protein